jgi:integrase
VDLQQRRVHVRRHVGKVKGGYEYGEPKTKRSRRQITFPAEVADALREHRVRQHTERLAIGPAWEDGGLVFPDETGRPLSPFRVYPTHFLGLVKAAGVPCIRFHDLRHTCATNLLGRGVNPKIVSEMLGHSSVAITLDIYSHVLPDMQQAASDEMGSALFG